MDAATPCENSKAGGRHFKRHELAQVRHLGTLDVSAASLGRDTNPGQHPWAPTQKPCANARFYNPAVPTNVANNFGHASCFEEKVFGRMSCLLLPSTFETIPLHEHPPTNLCVGRAFCAHSCAVLSMCRHIPAGKIQESTLCRSGSVAARGVGVSNPTWARYQLRATRLRQRITRRKSWATRRRVSTPCKSIDPRA